MVGWSCQRRLSCLDGEMFGRTPSPSSTTLASPSSLRLSPSFLLWHGVVANGRGRDGAVEGRQWMNATGKEERPDER